MLEVLCQVATLMVSLTAFVLALTSYRFHRAEATLAADGNIVNYVMAMLDLLERVKKLGTKEKELMSKLLSELEFFDPSEEGNLRPYFAESYDVDEELKRYFANNERKARRSNRARTHTPEAKEV